MSATNYWSKVYIRAVGDPTKIYMDIQPHPDPLVKTERPEDTITWQCIRILEATDVLIWALYMTFDDIYVDIDDGEGERLCRWADGEGYKRIKSDKPSKAVEFNFVIVDSRSTDITFWDSGGANAVNLPYEAFPFPEPIQQKDGTSKISFSSLYITRAIADSLKAKFPNDVRLRLNAAGSTYLCRWESLNIIPSTENNLRMSCDLTVITVVGGVASSLVYIYDSAGANGVRLEEDPSPFPALAQERTTSSVKCCPGLVGAVLTSGERIHFDGGVDISDAVIEFSVPYLRDASRTTLLARFRLLANAQISLDSGATKYTCIFQRYKERFVGVFSAGIDFRFLIIS